MYRHHVPRHSSTPYPHPTLPTAPYSILGSTSPCWCLPATKVLQAVEESGAERLCMRGQKKYFFSYHVTFVF